MSDYWNNLTARERLLIGVAGGLTFLVLFYFLLIRPLNGYVAESEHAVARAQATYQQIAAGAAEISAIRQDGGGAAPQATESPRVVVARTARDAGVAISRIQPGANEGLTVWVENVPSPLFYRWLQVMADQHGVAPSKVIAQKSTSEGRLRVQLQFEGGA